ncbi:MAG: peptide chain release factor 2 [Deltaproteobacteria bacterium]|nr:peptide chain release factor 2 [Deltaproteobacteria bacterium]
MFQDISQIYNKIDNMDKDLKEIKNVMKIDDLKEKISQLEKKTQAGDFWDDNQKAQSILKKASNYRSQLENLQNLDESFDDTKILIQLAEEEKDSDALKDGWEELLELDKKIQSLKMETILSGKIDNQNCLLAINAGAGGVEAMDWAEMLQRMYLRWCQNQKFDSKILELQPGTEAGIASCTILIEGNYAYGKLKSENGVHRLVRISPFDSNSRRHTSFASVLVTPDLDDTIEVEINEEDLRVDVYRASGAGGQHVNKTESAVRLTHKPTGLVTACQNERSQHQNKATALRMLKAKLYQLKQKEQEEKMSNLVGDKKNIDFGSQIRSYVLAPYQMATDHRTDIKIGNVEGVLDGDLDEFIFSYLLAQAKNH